MAGKPDKKTDAKPVQKRKKNSKSLGVLSVFVLIGKPFYFLLSHLIIGLGFIFYIIGHAARIAAKNIVSIPSLFKFERIRKIKKGREKKKGSVKKHFKFAFKIPFIKLPDLGKILKPDVLRLDLFFLKLFSKLRFRVSLPKLRLRKRVIFPIVFLLLFAGIFYLFILKGLPSPTDLAKREISVSTKIYDRNGKLLYKIYKDENRTIVPLNKIPKHVQLATLAAEDAEFYSHPGFSIRGIFRALAKNLKSGRLQGGSTITQQLVKNALLTPEKTITRKIKEVILSVSVELTYSKDEILEMYLNEVSYGGTAYGIEEASYEYFGKGVEDLNLAEAAFLAGLPQSPTRLSPFGQNPELSFNKQKETIRLMKINKFISAEEEEAALNQKITLIADRKEIKAPHFVMFVRQILVDKFGEEMVEKGGLEVYTTLDLSIQEMAEKIVKEEVEKLKGLRVGNGAALVINPKTGEILAMVGSKDYFDTANDGNVNVAVRLRQPGSSIKIVNYAYALSNGYSPASIIDDSPATFVTPGSPPYSPKNYDGQFKGKIPLRIALAESRNIPAVKILASYGVAKMIEQGKKMGITSWEDTSRFGLSLTLGGGEVKLIELAGAYAAIANGGVLPYVHPIAEVKNYKGKILEGESKINVEENVVDPRVAFMLIDILKDNLARSGEFGFNSALVVKNHPEVAVKTGTSNDLKDNLTVGFNQDYLVAAWVGNNDGSPMSRVASGVTGASPIWNKIISTLLSDKPSIDWQIPKGLVKINCGGRSEWFLEEKQNLNFCATPAPDTKDNGAKEKVPQIL